MILISSSIVAFQQHKERRRKRPWGLSVSALQLVTFLLLLLLVYDSSTVSLLSVAHVHALPKGFVSEIVNSRTKAVTGAFAPNLRRTDHRPMMLLASKEGMVRVLENPENLDDHNQDDDDSSSKYINKEDDYYYNAESNLILDLSGEETICDNGQRGIQSIAIHPDFLETRWVYLYYTRWREDCLEDALLGPQNVLVRYTMDETSLLLEDQEILLESGILEERINNGGAMMFGTDGYLYLATGDGGVKSKAQDRRNLQGSLLRLKDDGDVPKDNPYALKGVPCGKSNGILPEEDSENEKDDVYCSEIYSWGFRNPRRMALNPNESDEKSVLFSISDEGAHRFEELSWAGTDFEEKNYGWPEREGPCALDTPENCPLPDSNLVDPFHYYAHTSDEKGGGSVGGSAFVPEGIWPDEFKYLVTDLDLFQIYNLMEDADAECRIWCSPPNSGFRNTTFYESTPEKGDDTNDARVVDMFFGPYRDTQALYVIKDGDSNSILRIRYHGLTPVAVIEIDNNLHDEEEKDTAFSIPISSEPVLQRPFLVGTTVRFDGSGSFDPDEGELTFQWDFGDGNDSTTNVISPSHVYDEPGVYIVILVVTNSKGQADLASTTVAVGNSPTAVLVSPLEGDLFTLGDILNLNGEAYDDEGNRIPEDQMTWEVREYHSNGYDFVLEPTTGNDFDLNPFPEPENLSPAEILFLRVILIVTDDNGLMTEVVTDLYPKTAAVQFVTEPEGLKINIDNIEIVAPMEMGLWLNFNLPVQVTPEQPPYQFQQWSDGNTNTSRSIFVSPPEAENVTTVAIEAIFCLLDSASCSNATTSCCGGFCNERGFCGNGTQESSMIDVDSRPTSTEEGVESVRKPIIPDFTNLAEDDFQMSLASGSSNSEEGSKEQENRSTLDFSTEGKWLIVVSIAILLIAPVYFGWKYYNLKRKIKTKSKNSFPVEFQDTSVPPKIVETSSGGEESSSTAAVDSDETNVSLGTSDISSSTSNASFSSHSNRSVAIYEKIAKETERRAKLRAKYSSGTTVATTIPETPETFETGDSESPSTVLSTNIDDTLGRLDDLLVKCFERKLARSCRKQERKNAVLDQGTCERNSIKSEVSNTEILETSESSDLVPMWLPSKQEPAPGSRLREKSDESFVEATFSMPPIYSAASLQDVSNESQALNSPEESSTSAQSLLIFQDSDTSTSNRESSVNESDTNTSLMESGLAGDGDKTIASDLNILEQQRRLLLGNLDDILNDSGTHDSLMESGLTGDGDITTMSDLAGFDQPQFLLRDLDDLDQYLGGY